MTFPPFACTLPTLGKHHFSKKETHPVRRSDQPYLVFTKCILPGSAGDITAEMRRSLPDWDGTLNLINLGFWPGGDRDGNPYVSIGTTKKVADRLRSVL